MAELPKLVHVCCDLCGANDTVLVAHGRDRLRDRPEAFRAVKCRRCGLIYLDPRPDPETLPSYYDESYETFTQFDDSGLVGLVRRSLLARQARLITAFSGGPGRLLEVGCGTGDLLLALESEGWQAVGIEPSRSASDKARARCRAEIVTGQFDAFRGKDDSFDAVVLKHVLEHLPSPMAALRRCAALLRPGGCLFVWTPNADSFEARLLGTYWHGYDMPRHLYDFTPDTIARYAQENSLDLLNIRFEPSPVDWIRGVQYLLAEHGAPRLIRRLVSARNPLLLIALFPVALLSALVHKSDRIMIVMRKRPRGAPRDRPLTIEPASGKEETPPRENRPEGEKTVQAGRFRRTCATLAKLVICIVLCLFLVSRVNLGLVAQKLLDAPVSDLAWFCAIMAAAIALQILRWHLILVSSRPNITIWMTARHWLEGAFLGSIVPGAVGLDIGRSYVLWRKEGDIYGSVASAAVDRIYGWGGLMLVSALALAYSARTASQQHLLLPALVMLTLGVGVLLVVYNADFFLRDRCIKLVPRAFGLRRYTEKFLKAFRAGKASRSVAVKCVIISMLIGILVGAALLFALRALGPVDIHFMPIFIVVCMLVAVVSLLPISPISLGLREAGFVEFLALLGIDREQSLGAAILMRAFQILVLLIGGLIFAASRQRRKGTRRHTGNQPGA